VCRASGRPERSETRCVSAVGPANREKLKSMATADAPLGSPSGVKHRLLPGTSVADAFRGYSVDAIRQSEGSFAAQELIQQLISFVTSFNFVFFDCVRN
jgi:hypothetical protein